MTKLLSDEDATGKAKEVFDEIREAMGMVPNFFRAIGAQDPEWLELNWMRHKVIMGQQRSLDRKTKELVAMTVSYNNNCSYCAHAHEAMAEMMGATKEEILEAKRVIELFVSFNTIADTLQIPEDIMPG